MKKNLIWLAVFTFPLLLMTACGGGSNTDSAEGDEAEAMSTGSNPIHDMALKSPDDIEDWVALVVMDMNQREWSETDLKVTAVDGKNMEIAIYDLGNEVHLVRAAEPSWEDPTEAFRYFTRGDEVIVLEGFAKIDEGYEIDRFYFVDGKVVEARSRKGPTKMEAMEAVPGPYQPDEKDHVFPDYERVQARAKLLKEVHAAANEK